MNTFHNEVNILFTYPLFSQSPSSLHDKDQICSSFLRFALADVFKKNEKKKSVKNCRSIGLNRAKKSKICAMSVLKKNLIVLCISDNMYKK